MSLGILIISEKGKLPTKEQVSSLSRIRGILDGAYRTAKFKGVGQLTGSQNPYFNVQEAL
jgi:hypothetical protein